MLQGVGKLRPLTPEVWSSDPHDRWSGVRTAPLWGQRQVVKAATTPEAGAAGDFSTLQWCLTQRISGHVKSAQPRAARRVRRAHGSRWWSLLVGATGMEDAVAGEPQAMANNDVVEAPSIEPECESAQLVKLTKELEDKQSNLIEAKQFLFLVPCRSFLVVCLLSVRGFQMASLGVLLVLERTHAEDLERARIQRKLWEDGLVRSRLSSEARTGILDRALRDLSQCHLQCRGMFTRLETR